MTLQHLRWMTVATIAAAVVCALLLSCIGAEAAVLSPDGVEPLRSQPLATIEAATTPRR